jgi:hypothetical protein
MDYLYNQASVYAWALRQDHLALRYSIANLRAKQRRGVPDNHLHMIMGWSNLAKDLGNVGRATWAEQASAHAVRLAEANPVTTKAHYAILIIPKRMARPGSSLLCFFWTETGWRQRWWRPAMVSK